ncbi:MAG: RdgB/HAM1 family non-canonical purine NTP pyrophosphatase [Streptosporangiales bacterium]|nr:RdgB/HAM1 family non-canonical purine NTP pyrophosphatase [Streptosporangiales bacterium]
MRAAHPDPAGRSRVVRLLLATRNAHKVEELRRILAAAGIGAEIVDASAFPEVPDVAETGATFADNALLKARAFASATALPSVADDSGIAVDALNGMPGVLSARWSGRDGDDRTNLALVLDQLADVPDERRGASFVCAAAVALPDGTERVVEGTLPGLVVREPRGGGGFGYDPVFVPEGETRTTAELSPDEKDAISHRGRAFRALIPVLRDLLAT